MPDEMEYPEDKCDYCHCPRRCHTYSGRAWCANPQCPYWNSHYTNRCANFVEEKPDYEEDGWY